MSNYTKTTDFEAKDSLPTGDAEKIIRGADFETEFDNIATAIATKADTAGPTFTGTVTIPTAAVTTLSLGGTTVTSTATEINLLDGVTATTAELNLLDGVTATTAELNILDGVTATAAELNTLDGITATTAELNTLDGFTGTFEDLNYAKTLRASGVTGDEFDILDGLTATAAELNILDGATVTTAELNLLDGVTATTAELNILDGVTSTAAELNILDGVTSTAAELNLVDGSTAGTVVNSKAVVYGAAGEVNATTLQVGGVAITSTPAELNLLDGATVTTDEINILDGVTATTAELNLLDGVTATTAELNILDGVTATATELNTLDGITSTTAELNILNGVTATTAELNILDGVTATAAELNTMDGITATTAELNILDGVTADATELNKLDGVTATTSELNYVDVTTLGVVEASKAVTADANADVLFSDNDKLKFGAGSDLQIYHDVSDSVILDNGTGNLKIQANDLVLKNADGSKEYLKATNGGSVRIRHNNTTVLETTSTGIDVTGTVTTDGISSSGDITITESTPSISFVDSDGTNQIGKLRQVSDTVILSARNNTAYGNFKFTGEDGSTEITRLQINGVTGDITFYDTDGSTASFAYDASAGLTINEAGADRDFRVESNNNANMLFVDAGNDRVGIAESSPDALLHINATSQGNFQEALRLTNSGGGTNEGAFIRFEVSNTDTHGAIIGARRSGSGGIDLRFDTGEIDGAPVTAMTIDHDQNVGIGVGSGSISSLLHVGGNILSESSSTLNTTVRATGNNTRAIGNYQAHDSSGNDVNMVLGVFGDSNRGEVSTNTNHTLRFYVNNTPSKYLEIATTGQIFTSHGMIVNEDSNDSDFRVESNNNTHMLYVDGQDHVNIGTSSDYGKALNVNGGLEVRGTGDALELQQSSAGSATYYTMDNTVETGGKRWRFGYTGASSDKASFTFYNQTDDEIPLFMGAGRINLNHSSDDVDTVIKSSNNSDMFYVDAGSDRVGVGGAPTARMQVTSDGTDAAGAELLLQHANNNTNDVIATVNFANNVGSAARIRASTTGANNTGLIQFFADNAGTDTQVASFKAEEIVFNETSANMDFRVESNNDTHCLYVDAGNDRVLVGTTAATAGTDFVSFDARPGSTGQLIQCGRDDTSTKNQVIFTNPNGTVGSIQTAGSATAYNTSSDARLKENIADADDAGELIDAIQVRQFDWIADGEHQRYGMVAQELNTVAPEAVSEGETEEDMMAVDYSKLVPMLVKEIQSLRARVAQLESN